MEESKKVILIGVLFFIFVALCLAIYYFFIYEKQEKAPPLQEIPEEQPFQVPLEKEKEEMVEPIQIELDKSDELVRELAQELSSLQVISDWLMSKDLIRKFTGAVDNIAHGLSPRPQIDFFSPEGDFKVIKKNGLYFVDPESYTRYDLVADAFLSVDIDRCVKLYRQLELPIQEAYQDLGYPEGDFHKTLKKAIIELLKVPVVEGEILLNKKVVTYMMADPTLENLSEAQKNLLRMGPENIRIIQEQLRKMALALGIPEYQLPQ